jgi:hypothetical protein
VNAGAGRRSVLAVVCVLAFAIAAMVALPTGASAFGISGFNYSNSNLQAGGHPNVAISFNRTGSESEDLKDVRLDLPTGVFANPEAGNPKCTVAQFNADSCPGNAQVGSVSTSVKALSLLDLDIAGTIDVITPDAGQVATLGLTLRPEKICILFVFCAQPQKIFLKTGITIKSYEDSGLRTYTPGTPKSAVIGIPLLFVTPTITGDITINKLALNFQSNYGEWTTKKVCGGFLNLSCSNVAVPPTGGYFWRQAGSCLQATSNVSIVSYQGVEKSASSSYTPTGCKTTTAASTLPFNPAIKFTPSNSSAGAGTPVTFDLSIPEADAPIQQALPKIVDVDFPAGSGLDLNALSGVVGCTETQLKARACPAASQIGTANAFSKFLPGANANTPGLVGKIFAMGVGNQIPVGVELIGPRDTVVIFRGTLGTRGDANAGNGRVYATFDRIPQLPFTSFSMTIAKPVFKNAVPAGCTNGAAQGVSAVITGFDGSASTGGNGTVVTRTSSYPISNCPATPDTTIGTKPPSTTTNTTPNFTFSSNVAGASFQCAVDSNAEAAFSPCSTPYTTQPLSDGSHTFYVRAVNAGLVDPTPASYTFTVSTQDFQVKINSIVPSTTQARAHPNVSADVDVIGGQPKQISLRLPEGFSASLNAVPTCATSAALAGNCAANTKIGTIELTVNTGSGPDTGVGEIYLTDGPTANDAGGVAIKVQLAVGTYIAQGGAYLVDNGKNQYIELRSMPTVINGADVTVTNLKLNFSGASNFLTNPSNCTVNSAWTTSGLSYAGNQAGASSTPFQATGCASLSFNPTINQAFSSLAAGTTTGVTADVTLGTDNSGIKTLRVNEPPSIGPNFPAFGTQADQCPASAAPLASSVFDPSQCPASAIVGTMTINTPLLPNPLNGTVYLINKSPLPWLGVKFDSPGISVRLTGVTATPQVDPSCDPLFDPNGFCQTQISILFNNVPDVPINSIRMVLDGPNRQGSQGSLSGKILTLASSSDPTCVGTSTANATFTPFSGTGNVARSQNITMTGCQ